MSNEKTKLGDSQSTDLDKAVFQMYKYIQSQVQCSCIRQFPYHGKIVTQCGRCRVMEEFEMAKTGDSERKRYRETSFKV
jgi:hypothetical protein